MIISDIIPLDQNGKAAIVNHAMVSLTANNFSGAGAGGFRIYGYEPDGGEATLAIKTMILTSGEMTTHVIQCKSIPVVSVYWELIASAYVSELNSVKLSFTPVSEINFTAPSGATYNSVSAVYNTSTYN